MATAATAKQVKVKQTKPEAVEDSLEGVYEELVKILQRHAPPFRSNVPCMAVGKRSFQLTVPKPVAIPGAYGGKPVDLQMAAAMLQQGYVGFFFDVHVHARCSKEEAVSRATEAVERQNVLPREDFG
jgi:hypothetical protein